MAASRFQSFKLAAESGPRPLLQLIRRHAARAAAGILGRTPPSYAGICERQWQLSPGETRIAPPAIFLDGQLDRVHQDPRLERPDHRVADHLRKMRGGPLEHNPTTAYLLRDAWLLVDSVWKGRFRDCLLDPGKAQSPPSGLVELPSASLACTVYGNTYFGHWLHDDVLLTLAARDLAPPVRFARAPYFHEAEYRRLFDVDPRDLCAARVDELFVLDDRGKNAHFLRRFEGMRSRFRGAPASDASRRIFVRRGRKGRTRPMTNEADIEPLLVERGFRVIDPEQLRVEEILEQTRGARVVVGVEGSHLAHVLYTMAEDGVLLVLEPPDRFVSNYKIKADMIGVRFAFVVGILEAEGFRIPPDDLKRTLDLVD